MDMQFFMIFFWRGRNSLSLSHWVSGVLRTSVRPQFYFEDQMKTFLWGMKSKIHLKKSSFGLQNTFLPLKTFEDLREDL